MKKDQTSRFQDIPWDDGHLPESLPKGTEQILRTYPHYHTTSDVQAEILPEEAESLADEIYQFTLQSPHPTWGTYVTLEEIQKQHPNASLAVRAASTFLPSNVDVHGVAVWALSATIGSQVPYHIDYAEYLRYSSGRIVLPVLAGTWQVSRNVFTGGDFVWYEGGLEHYKRFGYKGVLEYLDDEQGCRVPYRFNQMIVQAGHLPHRSTRIEASQYPEIPRVIVGFNVFLHDVGAIVQQFPEHSDAFRDRVAKDRQALSLRGLNPKLRRLLVLAKRELVKRELEKNQRLLDERVRAHMVEWGPIKIQDLVVQFRDENWSENDLHVHLHHQVQEDKLVIVGEHKMEGRLVSLESIVALLPPPAETSS